MYFTTFNINDADFTLLDATKEGYVFAGWATTADGPVAYADNASVLNLALPESSVTLYAVWEKLVVPAPSVRARASSHPAVSATSGDAIRTVDSGASVPAAAEKRSSADSTIFIRFISQTPPARTSSRARE